ncbi:MAG: formate dehydrogenase accessory protein FdhE [Gemmataceae bacterium]
MVGAYLRKWFSAGRPASKEVEEAQAELDRLAQERPFLKGLVLLLRDLLPLCSPRPELVDRIEIEKDASPTKLADGIPLLRGENIAIDEGAVRQNWIAACAIVAKHQDSDAPGKLAEAMRSGRLNPADLVSRALAGDAQNLVQFWEATAVDPSLAGTVLRMTLFPLLTSLNQSLTPLRDGIDWRRGYCPTCGTWPLLGEYRGLEQLRYLRCGLCAASWEAARLFCPFCGNRRHEQLAFLHAEGEESSYKAAVCNQCHGYVKMMSTLTALPPLPLLVADVATLHLDLIASERGYSCPP